MSNVMGIYVKFTVTTHQTWSCDVTLASNSENFYFSLNSILNFRKSYRIGEKFVQEQKTLQAKFITRQILTNLSVVFFHQQW